MALLILSLSFCLIPSQSSSEDQFECIDGGISAGVGQQITHVLYGGLCICSLGVDSVLDLFCEQEGVGVSRLVEAVSDRVNMEVMTDVIGHADTAVKGTECPMSSILYFLLLFCLGLLSLLG